MNRNDVKTLMSFREYPCVSIILPTHRTSPENKQDSIRLKNLIKEAQSRLFEEFSTRDIKTVLDKINSLAESIDHNYTLDGVAIYVNKNYSAKFDLPFPVNENVIIDETFATRVLVYTLNRSPKFWTIVLSEKPTRLFEGFRDQMVEIHNDEFPAHFEGEEWEAPRLTGAIVNQAAYRDERQKNFFRKIDRAFSQINKENSLPFVITGVQRYLSFFKEITENKNFLVGEVEGSYDKSAPHEIARLVWPLVYDHIEKSKNVLLKELDDAVSKRKYASGINEVWRFAIEGRVDTLLVEKDFHYPAISNDGLTLSPANDPSQPGVIDDAVDEVIETVISKGGTAAFIDNGKLNIHNRIAAILRY